MERSLDHYLHTGVIASGPPQAFTRAPPVPGVQVALGWTHEIIGRYGTFSGADDEDLAHLARAVDHFTRAGDLSGQAWAQLTASLAYGMKGDWAEAIPRSAQALALFRQTGDQAGQGWALSGLGQCHARLGNNDLGRRYARQALEVTPETGDPTILAFAWEALGIVHSRLGETRQAISSYRQALAFVRERENPMARGTLVRLLAEFGDACRAGGDLQAAAEAWQQAQQILRALGWPDILGIRTRLDRLGPS